MSVMVRLATHLDIFTALAEPARREILSLLIRGEQAVNAIVDHLHLAQPSVSKHLLVLAGVRLLHVRQSGRQRLYSVNAQALQPMHQWVSQFEVLWDRQLQGIKATAERNARSQKTV